MKKSYKEVEPITCMKLLLQPLEKQKSYFLHFRTAFEIGYKYDCHYKATTHRMRRKNFVLRGLNRNDRICDFAPRLLQWVPNYFNPDYPNSRLSKFVDVAMFLAAAGKRRCGHWSSATGESKPAL